MFKAYFVTPSKSLIYYLYNVLWKEPTKQVIMFKKNYTLSKSLQ